MQQQHQHPKIRNNPLSPIEQLLVDRANIEAMCREQEKKLGEDFARLRDHAPGLILSGVSFLLFSSGTPGKKAGSIATGKDRPTGVKVPFTASDYLSITKNLLPVAWSILQPILITWGINKAKSLIFGFISGKKKISH